MKKNELLIITGLSGAGKSTVAEKLEDLGYYVIDNLPYQLLNKFLSLVQEQELDKIAIVTNVNETNITEFFNEIMSLKKNKTVTLKLIYLYASFEIINRRFKETRVHPLAKNKEDIVATIKREKKMLLPFAEISDYNLDTSNFKASNLKEYVVKTFSKEVKVFNVVFVSFGFKFGIPIDADMVFDVRFLPNPFYVEDLKRKNGLDKEVNDYVFSFKETNELAAKLTDLIKFVIPEYKKEGRSEIVIAIGCTGGQHRSVAIVNNFVNNFSKNETNMSFAARHKEMLN